MTTQSWILVSYRTQERFFGCTAQSLGSAGRTSVRQKNQAKGLRSAGKQRRPDL